MPFIDDEQLAALYKEVDQERRLPPSFEIFIKKANLNCNY